MDTIELQRDWKEFLELLNVHQVRYLVVGGLAVAYHGYVRGTGDVDVWVARDPENAAGVVAALTAFGFELPGVTPETFTEPDSVVILGHRPVGIDILTAIPGVEFEECYEARVMAVLDGVEVPMLSLPHLRASKRACTRLKDADDLEHLP
jgi:hypothetical protein